MLKNIAVFYCVLLWIAVKTCGFIAMTEIKRKDKVGFLLLRGATRQSNL